MVLRCSIDDFSQCLEPVIPYEYEESIYKFKQLSPNLRNYIRFVIDTEYDRMLSLHTKHKLVLKCFEFPNVINGHGEYDSRIIKDIYVDCNEITQLCTFCIHFGSDQLLYRPFREAVIGFQYLQRQQPRHGEIWLFLEKGFLYLGRFYKKNGTVCLRDLINPDEVLLDLVNVDFKKMGRFVGIITHNEPVYSDSGDL